MDTLPKMPQLQWLTVELSGGKHHVLPALHLHMLLFGLQCMADTAASATLP